MRSLLSTNHIPVLIPSLVLLFAIVCMVGVHGGERTVRNWYQRWDGTAASLQQRKGAGRPNILTATEVRHNIQQPIRRSNRLAQQVKYTKIAEQVRQNTGKSVSVQTVRRIGKQQLGASRKRGKKRTAAECQYIHT
jgi:transposase